MRAIRVAGWSILAMVVVLLATDVWSVLARDATHPVVTWGHAAMLGLGLVAVAMTSEEVTNRIVRLVSAARAGAKGGTDA
jgi:hypothetical protein